MLYTIHPIMQAIAGFIALFVLYLGIQRFRMLHLRQKVTFNWKRHVFFGEIASGLWFFGIIAGMMMVYLSGNGFLSSGTHAYTALIMLPLIIFGFFSGRHMNRIKMKRQRLPFIHGLINTVVVIMAINQAITGWGLLQIYVF